MDTQDIKSQEIQGASSSQLRSKIASGLEQLNTGSLPVLLGLILIAVIFQIANPNFLTPLNLTNLMVQISAVGTISVGVVLVRLTCLWEQSAACAPGSWPCFRPNRAGRHR